VNTVIAIIPPPPPAHIEIVHLAPHPRLWISADGRAHTPSLGLLRKRMQESGAARSWSVIQASRAIQDRALVYLLTGDPSVLAQAVEQFQPVRDPHRLAAQALAYDWLYQGLNEGQRHKLAELLLASADAAWERTYARLPELLHNIPTTATAAQCLAALAAADEFPDRAQSVFDRGWRYQREIVRCTGDRDDRADRLNPIYPLAGGGWPEGHDYDRHGTLEALALWLALRSAGGPDFVSGSRFLDDKLLWYLQGLLPSGDYMLPVGDTDFPGNIPSWHDLHLLAMSAAAEGPHAPYLRDYLDHTPVQTESAISTFLFVDPGAPRRDWRTLPTDYFAGGVGTAAFRSSWEKDASYVAVQASDHFVYHQQNQDGALYLYRNAPLAWRSGVYDGEVHDHNVNYVIRTIAANCILVTDPREQFRGPNGVEAVNDGGQVIGNWMPKADDMEALQRLRAQRESYTDRVTWLAYESGQDYGYAAFEYGRAYLAGKVPEAIRQVVFLKPDWVVVLDRVTSGDPGFQKTFVLHAPEEMAVDPATGLATITTRSGPATAAPGRLFCRTLLPQGARLARVGGPDQEFVVAGVNRPHRGGVKLQLPGMYRLEVAAPTGQATTVFLHAFYLCPSAEMKEMPRAELLSDDDQHTTLSLAGGQYVLRFPLVGAADWQLLKGGTRQGSR
jgi:hypothetical protein